MDRMEVDIKIENKEIKDSVILNNSGSETTEIEENRDKKNESIRSQENDNSKDIKANKPDCFQCKICPYNTFREPFLDKHMVQKHGFSKVKAPKKNRFSYNDKINSEVMCSNGKVVKKKFKFEGEKDYDDTTEFGCKLCDFKTRYFDLLTTHQKIHEGNEKEAYQCTQCTFKTEEISSLRDHENTHKKLTLYACPHCDYATRQKCNLKSHMKVHEDPEKLERFTCATCKKFVSFYYSALLRHIKMKHGTNGIVFKCDGCPFTTKIQRRLTNHRKIHAGHDDTPMFKCEKCDFVTYNEQTIQRHVQRHEERQKEGEEVIVKEQGGENDIIWFCCNMCDFRSKDQRYVILHKKVHTRVDEINKIGERIVQSVETKTERGNGSS